ncbi:MAG: NAD(P)H-hydrate dehydratase, partial [Planctomycetes bacterium]|nr:NAD(P)H-hydrate dehydratase [Planctomycetota bacterium]
LPARPEDAHKGSFGRVLIVAGSRGMSGAASLAGLGALRGGAGLVYVAAPAGIVPIIAAVEPSYLTIPLPEDASGRLSGDAGGTLKSLAATQSAVAIGPGWGQSDELTELACQLYRTVERPMVVDADALNALAKHPDVLSGAKAERILTPHPGEFARLIGSDIAAIQSDRENTAAQFARDHGVVLLLKGSGTVITDGHRLAVNNTGNSGMATGGAGDVLTGLIAALLAQGMAAFEAAQLGAHLHGLAGDLAADDLSQPGLIASDLPRYLALAWKRFDSLYGEPF